MNRIIPLMQREWLQHRFGWLLMIAIPLVLVLLSALFAQVRIDNSDTSIAAIPLMLAVGAIAITAALLFGIVWFAALIIVSGLARRDHSDRSIEFWLSLPVGHSESLLSPMLVHLLIAPAVALVIGLASGVAMSLALVSRMDGIGAWLALPWSDIILATLAVGARLLVGLPLATLWLLPLIMAVVLASAWFRKWSWVVIGAGVGLGSVLLERVFGQPFLSQAINGLIQHAGRALVYSPAGGRFQMHGADGALTALRSLPSWAAVDTGNALSDLASPLLLGGLVVAAVCFTLLVQWRERNAGA